MRNREYFRNKKVTIVGLARSGLACANLFYDLGSDVSITDNQNNNVTQRNAARLKSKSIKVELGQHSENFIKGRDFIVVSPGVASDSLPLAWAKQFSVPVISEIEVGWLLCPARIIAVTGSNGKTTVTTLIGKILEAKGEKVFVCGNIGNPFCAELEKMKEGDFVSLEVSSFQLETIKDFKPNISIIINFTKNHLDRYRNMQEYLEAKKRIFMNQNKNDYLILNSQDRTLRELAKDARANIVYFSAEEGLNPNQAAVMVAGKVLGIGREMCLDVFKKFNGVEHRLEYVTEINNIRFINDSKATTVDSAIWALENIASPILLIAGGKDKGLDYSGVLEMARKKVREVVLIGEARQKLKGAFKGLLPINEAESLEEAVSIAFSKAKKGDSVLLSPMCSSFDMFSDYEERGRVFKEAVFKLAKDKLL